MNGYININRDILNNPVVCKDSTTLAVMVWLIKEAAYTEHDVWFAGKVITLKPGQLVTGRRIIGEQLNEQQSRIERTLKLFESEHLIEQQTNSRGRLISLLFMMSEEKSEQQSEQQVNNERTASEQQANSKMNTAELKNITKGIKDTKGTKELKEKGVSNDTPKKKTQASVVDESDLPADVKAKLLEWLRYKAERRQGYKETGLSALIRQVSKFVDELGADAVNDRLEQAMSSGWSGPNFDKIQGARSSPTRAAPGSADDYLMRVARGEA